MTVKKKSSVAALAVPGLFIFSYNIIAKLGEEDKKIKGKR